MARAYDTVRAPGSPANISAAIYQAKRPGGRVLVNSGYVVEVTNRDKIPLIHMPLWTDASYSNSGAIWLGGGYAAAPSVGAGLPYA